MDRAEFHKLKALSAICQTLWQQRDNIEKAENYWLTTETLEFRRHIQAIRADLKKPPVVNSMRMQERSNIVKSIRSMYENSRKVVTGVPGKAIAVSATVTNNRSHFSFTVRWGWYRKVYLPFYDNCNLDCHEYFVMAVEQVRVNHPHIVLFEAQAYDFKEKRQRTMWIGQTKIGERRAAIKNTSSDAIRAAIQLFDKQFKKDLTERNDEHR